MSRDSSVGIAPTLQVAQAMNCSSIPYTGDTFIFSKATRTALGHSQPSTQYVHGVLSPGVKRVRREAEHSLTSSTEFQNMCSCISTTPTCLHVVHKDLSLKTSTSRDRSNIGFLFVDITDVSTLILVRYPNDGLHR